MKCVLNVTFPQQRIQPTLVTPSLKKWLFDLNPAIWNVSSATWAKLAFKQNKISGVPRSLCCPIISHGRVYICSVGVFGSMFQFPFSVFVAAGLAGVSVLYISVHTNEIKTLNETFCKFLKSSLLSLAAYYVIYLLSGEHGSRCNKR